jgi:hypothetical protein
MRVRTGVLAVAAACVACCAPLLLPLLAGAGIVTGTAAGGGLLLGLSLKEIVCVGAPNAALTAVVIIDWRERVRAKRAECACPTACSVPQ